MTHHSQDSNHHCDSATALLRRERLVGRAEPVHCRIVTGGSVAVIVRAEATSGRWVVKQVPDAPGGALLAEAEGLAALAASGTVAVPRMHYQGVDGLIMEVLSERPEGDVEYWEKLGTAMACLQKTTVQSEHGWAADNWLGRLVQENGWLADGHEFFIERRLRRFLPEPLVRDALPAASLLAIEHLCRRLTELVPPMPAVLLHGDFWIENMLASSTGQPVLIDPGVWYGWAEVDIGMFWMSHRPTDSDVFFRSWEEVAQPEPGWRERAPILYVRELLSGVAQFGNLYGAADRLGELLRPFSNS